MTNFEMAVRHIAEGTAYSWDLTILLGLGLVISGALRDNLLVGKTSLEEAAYISSLYARKQLALWRG
jgi:hypothetical protein